MAKRKFEKSTATAAFKTGHKLHRPPATPGVDASGLYPRKMPTTITSKSKRAAKG